VPSHAVKVEGGHLWVDLEPASKRGRLPHAPDPLARPAIREAGPTRVLGISTTAMDPAHPRYSTSEALLETALEHARSELQAEARLLRLAQLGFRHCEGFYSKAARACTWPCSITQMDAKDEMREVYEGVVHWADVILVATPIRWGAASSLYFKMVERMNCIQNQITTHDRVLMKDKVAAFVIIGGQDNVQGVAGQMMGFFGELGCALPPFPFVAHSRGWTAEDMERNVEFVKGSEDLREGTRALVDRAVELSRRILVSAYGSEHIARGGRKAHGSRDHRAVHGSQGAAHGPQAAGHADGG
jgi:multimeric flavodoxin WrbA